MESVWKNFPTLFARCENRWLMVIVQEKTHKIFRILTVGLHLDLTLTPK